MPELTVITVSHNAERFLAPWIASVLAHASEVDLAITVVDNGSDDAAARLKATHPEVHCIVCANHGFGHANNLALRDADSEFVLFINPDTKLLHGDLSDALKLLRRAPRVGLAGARQVRPSGTPWATIRRFPSPGRTIAEAFSLDRLPAVGGVLGHDDTRARPYRGLATCDWVSGSFMLARRTAVLEVGGFDERFFLYSEETDLCLRLQRAGWDICHLPAISLLHHEARSRTDPRLESQIAFANLQYAAKHFSVRKRAAYRAAVALKYALRATAPVHLMSGNRGRAEATKAALRVMIGLDGPPIGTLGPDSTLPWEERRASRPTEPRRTKSRRSHVLNLTFHGIGVPPERTTTEEREVWVSPRKFTAILDRVSADPRVNISFDDGNRSDVDIALPALLERGLTATFFVVAHRIGSPGYLGEDDLDCLRRSGMRVGSHGMAHRAWRGLSADDLTREIDGARRSLEEQLGLPVSLAACPFGQYDRTALHRLRLSGFRRVYTSDGGWVPESAWIQPRNSIRGGTALAALDDLLEGLKTKGAHRQAATLVKRLR